MKWLGLWYLLEKWGFDSRERCFFIGVLCGLLMLVAGLLLAIDYWLL